MDVAWDHHKVGYLVRLLQAHRTFLFPREFRDHPLCPWIQVEPRNDWKIICSSRPRGADDQRRVTCVYIYICLLFLFAFVIPPLFISRAEDN